MNKNKIIRLLVWVRLFFWKLMRKRPLPIKDVDDTITELLNTSKSLIRFGDGEIALIRGFDIKFQHYCEDIKAELIKALSTKDERVMVAIPDVFDISHLSQYRDKTRNVWIKESFFSYPIYKKYCLRPVYYCSLISRLYLPFKCDYEVSEQRFEKMKKIWNSQNILIVEGEYSRLGIGNDLFESATQIDRILCPSKDAFEYVTSIESSIRKQMKLQKYDLVILALGPTAKVIVFHLLDLGVRMLDLGHIDIEYEWFLKHAVKKEAVYGKEVNEVENADNDLDDVDLEYINQIVDRIC